MRSDERASLGWQVFEETNDAVFVTSKDYHIYEINPFAQRLTGLGRNDLIGRPLFELLSSEERDIQEAIDALSHTGIFHSREEYLLHRDDAEPLPVNVSISRIHTTTETFGVIIARDISERVDAERQLREANDRLEQRVAQRTNELAAVNKQLSRANDQLKAAQEQAIKQEQLRIAGQIASGMAHDINNSVTPIVNFSDALLSDSTLTKRQREQIGHIKTGAEDICVTVRRLQELKPTRGSIARSIIRVQDLLSTVAELSRPQWHDDANRRGVKITLEITETEPLKIIGDESALRSVLMNLVFNAIDAISDQGRIELSCRLQNQTAMIKVADSGVGMTTNELARCFEPFVTSRENGCGLGLSISQKIAQQHDGALEITSRPGQGTTVTLSLPVAAGDPSAKPESVSPEDDWKILLVDDDDLVRKSSMILMQTKGLNVDVAASGAEALRMLDENQYGIIISDLLLGEMNGIDLLRECRRRHPDIHTILTTGWIDRVGKALDEDVADATFQKPIEFDRLFETIAAFESR